MENPHERLRAARKNAGFSSASEAATALGIPTGTYLGHENGSRGFDVESAKKYSRRFKVTLTWLLSGEGPMRFTAENHHLAGLGNLEDELHRITGEEWEGEQPDMPQDEASVFVEGATYRPRLPGGRPEIDVRVGAGEGSVGEMHVAIAAGGTVTGHKVMNEWVFPEAFYRHELHASANSIIFQQCIGDSMQPTLQPGDRVIVDTAQNRFGADAIYVFDDGDGEPRVKRLAKVLFSDPEQVKIISDNPLNSPQTVELSRVRIIGRVVGKVSRL